MRRKFSGWRKGIPGRGKSLCKERQKCMTYSRLGDYSQCDQTADCLEIKEPDCQEPWIQGSGVGAKSYKQQGVDHGFLMGGWFGGMCDLERILLTAGGVWIGRQVRRPQPWAKGGRMRILETPGCEAQVWKQVNSHGCFESGMSLHLILLCSSGNSTSSTPISVYSYPTKLKSHLCYKVFTKALAANKFSILSALLFCICFSLWVPQVYIRVLLLFAFTWVEKGPGPGSVKFVLL